MNQIKLPPHKRPSPDLGMAVQGPRLINCPGCHSTLTITSTQEVVSGPCPNCSTHIDSRLHLMPPVPPTAPVLAAPLGQNQVAGELPLPPPDLIRQIVDAIMDSWMRANHQIGSIPAIEAPAPAIKPNRLKPEVPASFKFLHEVGIQQNPDTAFDAPEAPRKRSRIEGKALALFGGLGLLVLGFGASKMISSPSPSQNLASAPSAHSLPEAPHADGVAMPVEASQKSLNASLEAFKSAKTNEERLKWVLASSRIKTRLENYYNSKSADFEATRLGQCEITTVPVGAKDLAYGVAAVVAKPTSGDPKVLLLKRENSDESNPYLLDWETYIQEMDDELVKFVENPSQEPSVFRVKLQRKHLFDTDASDTDVGIALVTLAGQPLSQNIILRPGDSCYERLAKQLKWGESPLATIRLAWQTQSPAQKESKLVLGIEQFICWEAMGVGRQAEGGKSDAGFVSR